MINLQIFLLGIVQGITEFLPVSSSAHLILISEFFGWHDQGISHDIAVHVGTLGAVIYYFRKEIIDLFKDFFSSIKSKKSTQNFLYIKIIISTLPAIVVGFIIFQYFIENIRNIHLISFSCIIFGVFLFFTDTYSKTNKSYENISFKDAMMIGIFQCFAFIPGASRSGVVITISRFMGLNRESAAIYSMLLSIPIILASLVLAIPDLINENSNLFNIKEILFSSLIAFITAFFSIKFMMTLIKRFSFNFFVIYRILLGIIILLWVYL